MLKKSIAVSLLATATFAGIASNTFADTSTSDSTSIQTKKNATNHQQKSSNIHHQESNDDIYDLGNNPELPEDTFNFLLNLPTDANGACIIEDEEEIQLDNTENTPLSSSTTNDTTTVRGNPLDHCNGFVVKRIPKKLSINPPTDFIDSNNAQNSTTNHVAPKTPVLTPAQQETPATDNNISQQEPAQTPSSSHTKLKELPNTGMDAQTSPLAIFGVILLGGALLAYRPVTSLSKSNQ